MNLWPRQMQLACDHWIAWPASYETRADGWYAAQTCPTCRRRRRVICARFCAPHWPDIHRPEELPRARQPKETTHA